jgi:hypothetical protein
MNNILQESENIMSVELATAIDNGEVNVSLGHNLTMLSKEDQIRLLPRAIEATKLEKEIDYLINLKRKNL